MNKKAKMPISCLSYIFQEVVSSEESQSLENIIHVEIAEFAQFPQNYRQGTASSFEMSERGT